MKNWFLSQNGAITISIMAFLVFLGRLFLDWRYESDLMGSAGSVQETIYVLFFLAVAGGWIWAMLAATSSSRHGLIACLVLALLVNIGFALATYLAWCPPAYCKGFPNLWPWNWAQLILGLLAVIVLVFQFRQRRLT